MADGTLRINGKTYDLEELTLDEVEQIEDACGNALAELDLRRAKVIKQIVYVLMRRDEPELNIAEVGALQIASLIEEPSTNGAAAK